MKNHEIKWKSSLQILHSTELFPHRLCSFHTLIFIHGENPASEQLVHILGKFSNLYKNTQLLDHFNITVPISLLRENQIFISVNFFHWLCPTKFVQLEYRAQKWYTFFLWNYISHKAMFLHFQGLHFCSFLLNFIFYV